MTAAFQLAPPSRPKQQYTASRRYATVMIILARAHYPCRSCRNMAAHSLRKWIATSKLEEVVVGNGLDSGCPLVRVNINFDLSPKLRKVQRSQKRSD